MATATHNGKPVTVPMKPSAEKVLEILRAQPVDGVCPQTFMAHGVVRYSARIHELRRLGFIITAQPCSAHLHPSRLDAYRVEGYDPT